MGAGRTAIRRLRQFTPDVRQVALNRHTDFRDGQAELIRPAPPDGGCVDENRVGAITRKNTQFHFSPHGDRNGTENSAPTRRQVREIPIPGQHFPLHGKMAAKLHAHPFMLALIFHRRGGLHAGLVRAPAYDPYDRTEPAKRPALPVSSRDTPTIYGPPSPGIYRRTTATAPAASVHATVCRPLQQIPPTTIGA